MSATIARTSTPFTSVVGLTVLSPYSLEVRTRTYVHDLAAGGIAVSLVVANPPSGTFEVLFDVEATARSLVTLLAQPTTFTLVETTMTTVNMTFVVTDSIGLRLDEETLKVWIVTVPYQAV
jgi:hypothetical protein